MTTKTVKPYIVEFFAASPRLMYAYRQAAKHNKRLTRHAKIQQLIRALPIDEATARKLSKYAQAEVVVLSHADDDPSVLLDSRVKSVVSRAFHLLFTGPATHSEQVAEWIRATKIRSTNRLQVIPVEDMEGPQLSQVLGRVCSAFERDGSRGSIIDAYIVGDRLHVRGPKYRMLHIPLDSIPALRRQPQAVLRKFEIDPDGSFLYWPDLDAHLGWNQFLQIVDPVELRKAQQRSADFNKRYGAAIRKLRDEAGILQTEIPGLTERQLRRIEHGESRATTSAIAALAKAHGLDPNAYMERLAKALQ
jgi:hypothetical protein